jgi:ABC-type transport system substrate-binding protein
LEKARVEPDAQQRLALYRQVEQLAVEDAAIIPLYYEVDYRLVGPRVHGLRFTPIGMVSVQGVTVDEQR